MPTPTKSKKPIIIGFIAVVLLIGVVGAALLLTRKKPSKQSSDVPAVTNQTKTEDTTTKTSPTECKELGPSDFEVIVNGAPDRTDGMFTTYKGKEGKYSVFFKYLFTAGKLTYDSPDIAEKSLKSVGRFSQQHKDAQWVIRLRGSIAEDTEAAKQIAKERVQKVATDLISNGIDKTKIETVDPRMDTSPPLDYVNIQSRYVQVVIPSDCSKS